MEDLEGTPLHEAVVEALAGGGAYFFRQLSTVVGGAVGSTDDKALEAALWDLVWSGRLTNDTLAPVRALTSGGRTAHRTRTAPPRARVATRRLPRGRPDLPTRTGPPSTAGRWSLLPVVEQDATRRAHASAEGLLERHGVVTRGAVTSERVPGGFAGVYKVLAAFEDSGRCRRGYFVGSLGAAQFGVPGAVDRLRSFSREVADLGGDAGDKRAAVALAATDPANPYGAALPWPERVADDAVSPSTGHRPGRKAGALVVMVDGELTVYVERGGRTLLTFTDDVEALTPAMTALATSTQQGALGRLTVERADGENILATGDRPTALRQALEDAGFVATPRGLRLRG
jgi:ATP-dependent Lhr-like helicase